MHMATAEQAKKAERPRPPGVTVSVVIPSSGTKERTLAIGGRGVIDRELTMELQRSILYRGYNVIGHDSKTPARWRKTLQ